MYLIRENIITSGDVATVEGGTLPWDAVLGVGCVGWQVPEGIESFSVYTSGGAATTDDLTDPTPSDLGNPPRAFYNVPCHPGEWWGLEVGVGPLGVNQILASFANTFRGGNGGNGGGSDGFDGYSLAGGGASVLWRFEKVRPLAALGGEPYFEQVPGSNRWAVIIDGGQGGLYRGSHPPHPVYPSSFAPESTVLTGDELLNPTPTTGTAGGYASMGGSGGGLGVAPLGAPHEHGVTGTSRFPRREKGNGPDSPTWEELQLANDPDTPPDPFPAHATDTGRVVLWYFAEPQGGWKVGQMGWGSAAWR